MDIRARRKGSVIILDLAGRIDVNSANLIETVGQCIRDDYRDILCNFSDIDFIDYMGISVIVIAYKEVTNIKGRMKFANIPAHLKNLFCVSGLDRVIEIYATEGDALDSFKEEKVIENIKKLQLRRRFKRLPIDIKISLKEKYDKKSACVKGEIINLSGVGAYIFGCRGYKLGDSLAISFSLPPKNERIELEAKVAWLSDHDFQIHMHPGMGVTFTNISKELQGKIIEFIDKNLSLISTEE